MVLPSPLAQARRAGEKGEGDFRSLHARGADIPAEPRLTTPRCTFGAALLDLPLSNTTVGVGGRKGSSAAAVLASRHHRRDLSSAARTAAALATITVTATHRHPRHGIALTAAALIAAATAAAASAAAERAARAARAESCPW